MDRTKPQTPLPNPLPNGEREHSASAAKQRSAETAMRRATHTHPLAPLGRGLGRGGDFMDLTEPQTPYSNPLPNRERVRFAVTATQHST